MCTSTTSIISPFFLVHNNNNNIFFPFYYISFFSFTCLFTIYSYLTVLQLEIRDWRWIWIGRARTQFWKVILKDLSEKLAFVSFFESFFNNLMLIILITTTKQKSKLLWGCTSSCSSVLDKKSCVSPYIQ